MFSWHGGHNSFIMFTLQHSKLRICCLVPSVPHHECSNTVYFLNMTHLSLLVKELQQRNYIFTFVIRFAFALTTLIFTNKKEEKYTSL
jgi:hypothetical protein